MHTLKRYWNFIKYFSNWPTYFIDKLLEKEVVIYRTRNLKQKIWVPGKLRAVFKEIFFNDFYNMPFILSKVGSKPTVIDIGANAGYFSVFLNEQITPKRVLCFEPIPANYEILKKNLANTQMSGIKLYNEAVGYKGIHELVLNIGSIDELTVIASQYNEIASAHQKFTVKATDLDKIITDNQLDQIDLLKMDCEGSEYDIFYTLEDTSWQKIGMIAMEVHELDNFRNNLIYLKKYLSDRSFLLSTSFINKDTSMLWAWKD